MFTTDATADCVCAHQQLGMLRRVGRSLVGCQNENLSEKSTPSARVQVPNENVCETARHAIKKKVTSGQTVETTKLKMMFAINVVPHRGTWRRSVWPMTLLCCCFIIVNSPANGLNYVDDDTTAELNTQAGARAMGLYGAREPRFGDRLLPLRKKTGAIVNVAAPSQRQVNSILSKSNYVVSYASANTNNAAASGKVVARATNSNATAEVNVSRNNRVGVTSDVSVSVEPKTDLYTMEVNHADYTDPPVSVQRRGKQLSRREDTNIGGLLLDSTTYSSKDTNISKADRLVVMSTEFFVVPTSTSRPHNTHASGAPARIGAKAAVLPDYIQPPPVSVPTTGPRSVLIVAPRPANISNAANAVSAGLPPSIVPTHLPFTGLRKEPWVVPVLVLAALTMLMMTAFEIFVLFKAWRTSPSRRHLFLGQMLLLGLFACAGLGAVLTAQPSLLSCGTIRFGVGVAYALVFAALLVKCVFLISLNGGVYLPAPYQGLLLLFAVLIQVAIGTQWLLTQPPEIYTQSVPILGNSLLGPTVASSSATSAAHTFAALFQSHNPAPTNGPSAAAIGSSLGSDLYARITAAGTMLIPLCKTQFSELLLSLIYIVFLIVFVAVLAIKSRGIRDNYREATYIGLAIGGAIPIWLGWMLCGLAVADRHKDACIAFGLIATSATVFLVMFMPKGRQLAAMGKEGLYVEDREEQFSSLSRAGSGYSPSFFHFKPIKYGVMGGGMQNSATNTGNGASMKHCSNGLGGGGGGDRVALVTAAPPSYTRMYHYFPAHLSAHPFCFYPQPPPPPPPPPIPPPTLTQLPSPPTLKQLGNSLSSMTQAHIAQTLRYPGLFIRPDETNLYTTLEPTLSSNPNVYFQRGGAVHPGMMY